ncbi:MAG: LysM peptidoglycan-binding domain-containing protein [Myxococcota bacterium]|nr:LysM peptidoglycan-binding domain-containing protein [Myxococcota bacterium]
MKTWILLCAAAGLAAEPPTSTSKEGSIWSEIEQESGVQLSETAEQATLELAEERFDEERFLGTGGVGREVEWGIYLDPVKALEDDPLHLAKVVPAEFDIPVVVNPMVEKWMRYFTGRGRAHFHRYLERRARYESMIHAQLEAAGLPRDLLYVSMVESGFSNTARSYASAVGLWQFMTPTGRAYGLRIDYWVDERTDPAKSTVAAAKYLDDLYKMQGDWYLAWASYNAGPGRVNAACRKHNTRNFWVVAEQETLAVETRNYVPKILAAAILGKHPERYGFTDLDLKAPIAYDTAVVEGSYTVAHLARLAGTDADTIESLNPALLRGATPPKGKTEVRLPRGTHGAFVAALAAQPEPDQVAYQRHKVRKGESLGSISKHYGVPVEELVRLNKIRDPNHIYPGLELVVPVSGAAPTGSADTPASAPAKAATRTTHTVRSGETLAAIATAYGVSIEQLVADNDLGNADHIEVGQKLTVLGGSPQATQKLSYTVKRGDSLSVIASDFGVTTAQIMEWNGLKDASHIEPGQVLKLYGASHQWVEYQVRAGDSLGLIAERNGCSVSDLRSWNDLSSSTIYPGQTLRIKRG